MATEKRFTNATGSPVDILTAGPRGPALLQDIWLIETQCMKNCNAMGEISA